jgi:CarD family transcriptional regulator
MRAPKTAIRTSPFSRAHLVAKNKNSDKPVEFKVGQKVVYPGHGVGQIQSIETKEIASTSISFYMIRVLESDVTVMVPVNKVDSVGLRPTVTPKEVEDVYGMLRDKKIVVEQTTWNRRYREYMEKIKTGSIVEIGEVVRDLCVLRQEKVLSFGERKMLELAKGLLVKELAIGEGTDEPTVEAQVEEIFAKSPA